MGFWTQNINGTGRIVRILCGIICLAAAVVIYIEAGGIWPWICGAAGLFMIFEGIRGWCVMRACKIRTPM